MGYIYLIPILITYSLLIIPIALSMDQDYELPHICLNSSKAFTSNYNEIRVLVVIDLISNAASNDGFMYASHTRNQNPEERAFGLALCRADISPDDCKICVNNASLTLINTHCPDSRAAITWRDFCYSKYLDVDFFRDIDTDNRLILKNDVHWNSTESAVAALRLLSNLSQIAIQSPKFFANGATSVDDYDYENEVISTLYGAVQCTRDLSADDCKTCLHAALIDLLEFCASKLKESKEHIFEE